MLPWMVANDAATEATIPTSTCHPSNPVTVDVLGPVEGTLEWI